MQVCMPNKQNNGAQHQQEHKRRRRTTTKTQLTGFNAFIITVMCLMSVCESVLQPCTSFAWKKNNKKNTTANNMFVSLF